MNARLCPNCSALIESESALFCYNCGQELSLENSITATDNDKAAKSIVPGRAKKDGASGVLLPIFIFLLFIIVFGIIGTYYFTNRSSTRVAISPTSVSGTLYLNEYISTASALPVAPFDLGPVSLSNYIPAEAEIYLQSRTPAIFLRAKLSSEQQEEFNQRTGLTLSEALSFLSEDYAFAKLENGFIFLSRVKDADFVKLKIDEFSSEELFGELFEDVLIISNSKDLLKSVAEVVGKTTLPLSQKNEFFDGFRTLPKTAQAAIYLKEQSLLEEALYLLFDKDITDQSSNRLRGRVFIVDSSSGSAKIEGVNGKD